MLRVKHWTKIFCVFYDDAHLNPRSSRRGILKGPDQSQCDQMMMSANAQIRRLFQRFRKGRDPFVHSNRLLLVSKIFAFSNPDGTPWALSAIATTYSLSHRQHSTVHHDFPVVRRSVNHICPILVFKVLGRSRRSSHLMVLYGIVLMPPNTAECDSV